MKGLKYESRSHTAKRHKPTVVDSSKEAFLNSNFQTDSNELFAIMKILGRPTTRKEISTIKRITKDVPFLSNQITQHVKTLINEGKILESKQKRPCPITGRNVYWLKVADSKPIQQELGL